MSDPAAREWRFYIDDMISFAEKVIAYTDGLDQARFISSGLNYDATVRNLELIGEAATHVPDAIRAEHPQVPWRFDEESQHLAGLSDFIGKPISLQAEAFASPELYDIVLM